MAYGLNYNLQQALRDGSSLFVNIYKDGYTGAVYNYTPTSITIEPNTISDEPEPGIISSQLNISFLLSSQADYNNFPVLLSFNDREYYVELSRVPANGTETVLWKGYMFNDYVNVPFTTGNLEVNITCIDALSFMRNLIYPYPDNINSTIKLKTVILTGLNSLGFPTLGDLFSTCSYYGSAMDDRADGTGYEPFDQTYIYKRDLVGKNLYDIIEQIMISFNCRLFQFQGNWWIMSANEMAKSTIYYSQYNASSNNLVASGTIANGVTVAPYSAGNVHFINNSQNKITRKGYPIIRVDSKVEAAQNYTHNSTFKQSTTYPSGFVFPTGWDLIAGSGGSVTWLQNANQEFDVIRLIGNTGYASFFTDVIYSPLVYPTTFTISFDAIANQLSFKTFFITVSINNFINNKFYLQSDGTWSFTSTRLAVDYTNNDNSYQIFTRDVKLGVFTISGTNYNVAGKLDIEFFTPSGGEAYLRNPRTVQNINPSIAESYLVTRTASTAGSLTKDFTTFLGLYKSDLPNIYGNLYYANGNQITQWYSFGAAGTLFPSLPDLLARELSNLLSRNYATLEGDLGETYNAFGLIYLANSYTVTDSASSALTYNGKKFLLNRVTPNLYINQNNSLQLLEITNTNNSSTSVSKWIVS
jgi:hypothetical protein